MARPSVDEILGSARTPTPPSAENREPPSANGSTRAIPSRPSAGGGDYAIAGDAYEGAARFDSATARWLPSLRSADADILPAKSMLDARSRDVGRNDAYVQSGANLWKDNIVGAQFTLNAKPEYKMLGLDEGWATDFQAEVETKFTLWAESPDNWPDAARRNTLTGLVRLAVGVTFSVGEVLAKAEWIRDGRPFNTAIQMVDTDRLSNPNNEAATASLRGGVQMDRYGAASGYHIRKAHPSDLTNPDSYVWDYFPARKPWGRVQIIHLFDQGRIDQTRGVSEMVAALKELKITKQFRDIVLQNAVVNATFAATIESEFPELASDGLRTADENESAVSDYFSQILEYAGGADNLKLGGVRIPHLYPGTKLNLKPAGQGGPLGTEFEQSLLRYIAANLGVSYEQLSRDYSESNYSSVRAAMTETWKTMQSKKRSIADRFASHIYRLWFEEAVAKGYLETMRGKRNDFYDKNKPWNKDAFMACDWIGASRGQIDELKETQAAVLRIKYNLSTHERELARFGEDWRKIFPQRQREQEDLLERKLVTDDVAKANAETQNMLNAASGEPSAANDGDSGDASEPSDGSDG